MSITYKHTLITEETSDGKSKSTPFESVGLVPTPSHGKGLKNLPEIADVMDWTITLEIISGETLGNK